jgi:serine/threonine-protein kinase HipA
MSANDHESHSYLEIADAIRQHGSAAGEDLRELWRRIVFTILISNTDDHLRNHGFLYDEIRRGWRLAPVYDVNPTPRSVKPGILTLAIDESNTTANLDVALDVAEYFDVDGADARHIAAEVRDAVQGWADRARELGVPGHEIDGMKSAFAPPAAG